MKPYVSKLILILFILSPCILSAQINTYTTRAQVQVDKNDSTSSIGLDSAEVVFMRNIFLPTYHRIDNSNSLFRFKEKLIQQQSQFLQDLGNANTAYYSLAFISRDVQDMSGYDHPYPLYQYNWKDVKWLLTSTPYSEVSYIFGSRLDQRANASIYRSISKNFKAGFDIRRLTSRGLFLELNTSNQAERQKAKGTNLLMNLSFQSNNLKHHAYLAAMYNTWSENEIGGVSSDSLYEAISIQQKPYTSLLMKGKNYYKKRGLQLTYTFEPSYEYTKILTDSTREKIHFSTYKIFFQSTYNQTHKSYSDTESDSSFYHYFFKNTTLTYDTLNSYTYTQELGLALLPSKYFYNGKIYNHKFSGTLSLRNSNYLLYTPFEKKDILTQSALLNIHNVDKTKISFNAEGEYHFKGWYQKSFHISGDMSYSLGGDYIFSASALIKDYNLSPYFLNYEGNHHAWITKQAQRTKDTEIRLSVLYKKRIQIQATQYFYKGYLYFDSMALPKQYTPQLRVQQAEINFDFPIGEWHLKNKCVLQKFSNTSIIHLPTFMDVFTFYYQNKLFAKKMRYYIGADMVYNSAFAPQGYMPDLQEFYLQNTSKQAYPLRFEPFLTFNVKRFDFLIKMTNAIDNLIVRKSSYYTTHYPQAPRAVYLGFSWKFYD